MDPKPQSTTLKRSKSGRDPRKGEGQRKVLESGAALPAAPINQTKSHNLIVCGSTNHLSFCMALREQGVEGDLFSCFPIERHFMWLKMSTSHQSILSSRTKKFKQWAAKFHELKNQGSEKLPTVAVGDMTLEEVEEALETEYGLKIGNDSLHRSVLDDMISGFKEGVQSNAIADACYSGPFVDVMGFVEM